MDERKKFKRKDTGNTPGYCSRARISLVMVLLTSFYSFVQGQIITNNAFISTTSGTVISVDTLSNSFSASFSNDGILNVYTINNAGSLQGNGTYNIGKKFITTGTFLPGTSTINYNSSAAQIIAPVNYYNLTIATTGTRTVTFPSTGTIGIANVLTLAGGGTSYTIDGSTLNFNGTWPQSIPAFPFYNLDVDNMNGATLSGVSTVTGTLKVNGQFHSDGYLTLLSTADQTALIDGSGTGEVLENVTVQRYLDPGFGYKYISSPFQSATVNELSNEVNLGAAFPAFYGYDEDLISSGWINYTNTSGILVPLHGYASNFGSSPAAITVDMTGVVNNNAISVALYNHNEPYTKGFNLVGNPYPSPIDWNATNGWTKTNIDDAIYYFDASDTNQYTGTYSSYINGISSDGIANNIIPAMQGFFVHVSDGAYPVAGMLGMDNTVRVDNLLPTYHKPEGSLSPLIRLKARFTNAETASDATVIYFDEDAHEEFEKQFDALKLMNTDANTPSIYSLSNDGRRLSINGMIEPSDSLTVIQLGLACTKSGDLTIEATALDEISPGLYIYFADAETGKIQKLKLHSEYSFYLKEGASENRFSILFGRKPMSAHSNSADGLNAYAYGTNIFVFANGAETELIISGALGQVVFQKKFDAAGSYEINTHLNSGIYVVTLVSGNNRFSKNIFIGDQ